MAGNKCKQCGSSEIEEDPGRGDAVCMNCGSVLESNLIVSEVQFQEGANGTSSAIGQFVSAESKGGGCGNFGNSFHVGMGSESREITLKKARAGITTLCNQLHLNQHYIDTACNFFKMALSRQLTRGRKNTHVFAACVYITCRTNGTSHLLIDISDALQICCYELGRTYLRLSKALCINTPSVDPCIYILRFANKLELGDKTQQVTTTALRLVQRMKRDSIHTGRRPSGLCGAEVCHFRTQMPLLLNVVELQTAVIKEGQRLPQETIDNIILSIARRMKTLKRAREGTRALLMAARLHDFNRNPSDIVKIVKVHESTLRKRLFEFGDTPSSALTLEEFMTVDLEEEQDPPAFKAARKKDKERLMKMQEENFEQITEIQKEIDRMLEESSTKSKRHRKYNKYADQKEDDDANIFITESLSSVIKDCIENREESLHDSNSTEEIGPNLVTLGLADVNNSSYNSKVEEIETQSEEILLDGLDEEEIDSYIMSVEESKTKDGIWTKINATYLEEQKIKQEKLAKEKEEGKTEKKKKRNSRKKQMGPSNSAGEAIEKMLQEKRLSSKINYDALRSLNIKTETKNELPKEDNDVFAVPKPPAKRRLSNSKENNSQRKDNIRPKIENVDDKVKEDPQTTEIVEKPLPSPSPTTAVEDEDIEEYYDDEQPSTSTEVGMFQMLKDYRGDGDGEGDEFGNFGFEEAYDEEY